MISQKIALLEEEINSLRLQVDTTVILDEAHIPEERLAKLALIEEKTLILNTLKQYAIS